MHIGKAKRLPPQLARALHKAKAKAKEKMVRASSRKDSNQPDHSEISDHSSSTSEPSEDGIDLVSIHKTSELFTAEKKDDLEQMLRKNFAAFSAEEYQAEIQPLFEDLLRFMHRQDALDSLG